MRASLTLVTALYDLAKIEERPQTKSISDYLALFETATAAIDLPMVIFTEPDLCDAVRQRREALAQSTTVIPLPFEACRYASRLPEIRARLMPNPKEPNKETPGYLVLMNNKPDFLQRAIDADPYQSTHFGWIDMGLTHIARMPDDFESKLLATLSDRIRAMTIHYPGPVESEVEFARHYHHRMIGGFRYGPSHRLVEFAKVYHVVVDNLILDGVFPFEQNALSLCYRQRPELFELYCGDYKDCLAHSVGEIGSTHWYFNAIRQARQSGETTAAYQMCQELKRQSNRLSWADQLELAHECFICGYYEGDESQRAQLANELLETLQRAEALVVRLGDETELLLGNLSYVDGPQERVAAALDFLKTLSTRIGRLPED